MQKNPFSKVPGNKSVINAMQRPNPTLAMTPGKAPAMSGGVKQALPPGAGQMNTGNGLPKAAVRGDQVAKLMKGIGSNSGAFAGAVSRETGASTPLLMAALKFRGSRPAARMLAGAVKEVKPVAQAFKPLTQKSSSMNSHAAQVCFQQGFQRGVLALVKEAARGDQALKLLGRVGQTAKGFAGGVARSKGTAPGEVGGVATDLLRALRGKLPMNVTGAMEDKATRTALRGDMVTALKGTRGTARSEAKAYRGAAGQTERVGSPAPAAQPNFSRPGWALEPVRKPGLGSDVTARLAQQEAYQGAAGQVERVAPAVAKQDFVRPGWAPAVIPKPNVGAAKERVAQREAYQGAAGQTEAIKPQPEAGAGFTRPSAVPMRIEQPPIRGAYNNARDQLITMAKQYPMLAAAMGGGSLIGAGGLGAHMLQEDKPKGFLDRLKAQL